MIIIKRANDKEMIIILIKLTLLNEGREVKTLKFLIKSSHKET